MYIHLKCDQKTKKLKFVVCNWHKQRADMVTLYGNYHTVRFKWRNKITAQIQGSKKNFKKGIEKTHWIRRKYKLENWQTKLVNTLRTESGWLNHYHHMYRRIHYISQLTLVEYVRFGNLILLNVCGLWTLCIAYDVYDMEC